MRPPLLALGDETHFADYQKQFDDLLPSGFIDVLGNRVVFNRDRCAHICYKPENKRWNTGPRDQWEQDRAERIPWIPAALQAPKYIRATTENGKMWAYMLEVPADTQSDLKPELYAAIVDAGQVDPDRTGAVWFVTAYTITNAEWQEWKRNRPWIYPSPAPPKKMSKRRGKKRSGQG